MMNLEELKNLNPKNPGSWPWAAKILAFVVLFPGLGLWLPSTIR